MLGVVAAVPLTAFGVVLAERRPIAIPDRKMLVIARAAFVLVLVSLWRPMLWMFWLGWSVNLWLVGVLVYLAFYWHPFG